MSFPEGPCSVSVRFGFATAACDAGHAPWSSGGLGSAFHPSLKNTGGRTGPAPLAGALLCASTLEPRHHAINAQPIVSRRVISFLPRAGCHASPRRRVEARSSALAMNRGLLGDRRCRIAGVTLSAAWRARRQGGRRNVWLALLLLASQAVAQPSAGDDPEAVRAAFLDAYTAARLGVGDPENDTPALRSYVLYPYLGAARLAYALQHASPGSSEIDRLTESFLRTHTQEAVTGPLHRDWLESLARRAEWRALLDHYDAAVATEALACQQLN